ncbi:MAG TPA: prephenate dehydrogenase/arogenate dehydrogenase family protein [Acidimicrobiia bacterium]
MEGDAAVIGTGLIGASVGLALRAAGWNVFGWDADPDALTAAARRGAVEEAASEEQAIRSAELVFLCGPLKAILEQLPRVPVGKLATDVAGVKAPVVKSAGSTRFVGGHPMAGRETSGPDRSTPTMFRGASWILTTDGADGADLDKVGEVVASFGAIPLLMSAADHDEAVAAVSHLPQVVASAMVGQVDGAVARQLAAGGFRDITRVAASDTSWWPEILTGNSASVARHLRALAADLDQWAGLIESGDQAAIRADLEAASAARRSLAAPVAALRVMLDDRPGEVARVGMALAASRVDLRDLELRHSTEGGAGVLTLSVRPEEESALRAALAAEGLAVI